MDEVEITREIPEEVALFDRRECRDLVWKDTTVTLAATGKDRKDKKILDCVSGEVPAKNVTAILGPCKLELGVLDTESF